MDINLVFCGVDRVGKSSLIVEWLKRHPMQKQKMRVPTNKLTALAYYYEYFQNLRHSNVPTVWDRGHICEQVYAPLYRPEYGLSKDWMDQIHNWQSLSMKLPSIIVYIYPRWRELLKADERPNANLLTELDYYGMALNSSTWPIIRLSKHSPLKAEWRDTNDVIDQLESELDYVLEQNINCVEKEEVKDRS